MERIKYIVNLLIVSLLLAAVAIGRDGRVGGSSPDEWSESDGAEEITVESRLSNGDILFDSAPIAKDIVGYGGRTPVRVVVRDGVVVRVESEINDETPSFYESVVSSGLLDRWNGMTLAEVASAKIDAVSGATFTSESIIGNVQRVANYGAALEPASESLFDEVVAHLSLRDLVALLVILGGVVVSFIRPKRKAWEVVQLLLNVVVLGFWAGSFLSMSQFVSWFSNGVNVAKSLPVVALLIVTLVMPLFGRKGTYCYMHCPMGSAQELLHRLPFPTLKLPSAVVTFLNRLRYYILFALLFVMWLGFGFSLIDYELFSAFILSSASTGVLVAALLFLVLSLIVHRPYCRFVCPTGALITVTSKTRE